MFMITIVFGPQATTWSLLFKTEEARKKAEDALKGPEPAIVIYDDFGQQIVLPAKSIQGVLIENTELSSAAHVERTLHVERIRAEAQQQAARDPKLRQRVTVPTGPAMISPGFPRAS